MTVIDPSFVVSTVNGWSAIMAGNIPAAVVSPFTDVFGTWFYVLMTFTAMMMIYFKWNDFNSTIIIGMLITAGELPFLVAAGGIDNIYPLIYALFAMGMAMILYKLFYKGG